MACFSPRFGRNQTPPAELSFAWTFAERFGNESPDVFNDVISHAEIKPKKAQEFIWENLESIHQQAAWQGVRIAPEVTLLVRQAQDAAQKAGRKIEAADLGQVLSKGKLEFLRTVKWKVA